MADTLQLLALQPPKQSFFDGAGRALVGGLVWTYAPGTTTPKTTYADSAGQIPNPNPTPISGFGTTQMFGTGNYDVAVYDRLGALLYTQPSITVPGTVLEVGMARDQAVAAAGGAANSATNAATSAAAADASAKLAAGSNAGQLKTDLAKAAAGFGVDMLGDYPSNSATPDTGWTQGERNRRSPLLAISQATPAERLDLYGNPTGLYDDWFNRVMARAKLENRKVDWAIHGRAGGALYPMKGNLRYIAPGTQATGFAEFRLMGDPANPTLEIPVFVNFGETRHDFTNLTFNANRKAAHAGMGHSENYYTRCRFTGGLSHGFVGYVPGAVFDNLYINATAQPNATPPIAGQRPAADMGFIADLLVFTDCSFDGNGYAWCSRNAVAWDRNILLSYVATNPQVFISANSPVKPDLRTMITPGDCIFGAGIGDGTARRDANGNVTISGLVAAVGVDNFTLVNAPTFTRDVTVPGIAVGHSQPGFTNLESPKNVALFANIKVSGVAGQNTLQLSQPIPFECRKYWDGGTVCRFNGEIGRIVGTTGGLDDIAKITDTQIFLVDAIKSTFTNVNLAVYHGTGLKGKRSGDNGRWQIRGGFFRGNAGGGFETNSLYGWVYDGGGQIDGNGYGDAVGLAGSVTFEHYVGNRYGETCACGFDRLVGFANPIIHEGGPTGEYSRREYIFGANPYVFGRLRGLPTYSGTEFGIFNYNSNTPGGFTDAKAWFDGPGRLRYGPKVADDSGFNLSPMVGKVNLPTLAPSTTANPVDYVVDVSVYVGPAFANASAADLAKYSAIGFVMKTAAENNSLLVAEVQNWRRSTTIAPTIATATMRFRNLGSATSGAAVGGVSFTNAS